MLRYFRCLRYTVRRHSDLLVPCAQNQGHSEVTWHSQGVHCQGHRMHSPLELELIFGHRTFRSHVLFAKFFMTFHM